MATYETYKTYCAYEPNIKICEIDTFVASNLYVLQLLTMDTYATHGFGQPELSEICSTYSTYLLNTYA
jgi:hypothetical protein